MESAARSEQILRDVRTTIGELVSDVFYTILTGTISQYSVEHISHQFSDGAVSYTHLFPAYLSYRCLPSYDQASSHSLVPKRCV